MNDQAHKGCIRALALNATGEMLASAAMDGKARLWSAVDGRLLAAFNGHAGRVDRVRFTPDGKRLMVKRSNGSVLLDTSNGEVLRTHQQATT